GDSELCCHMYQRSADWFLGVPWNVTSYAFLLLIVVELANNSAKYRKEGFRLVPGKLRLSFGDVHLYEQHLDAARTQIKRVPFKFPTVRFSHPIDHLEDLTWDAVNLDGYKCHPNDFDVEMIA